MSLIQTFPDGGGGGSNIPNGSTITPTDNIQIWLRCVELTETYTTLNEVLADDDVMEKLFRSENASDYLVRSTTWANDITANQTAMILIGANDYCANKLLSDSTWSVAIAGSAYWNEVLKGLVPVMTSNTTPYGECIYSSNNPTVAPSTVNPYLGFDGSDSTSWANGGSPAYPCAIGYVFPSNVKIYKAYIKTTYSDYIRIKDYKIQGSSDGTNWIDLYSGTFTNSSSVLEQTVLLTESMNCRYYRLYVVNNYGNGYYVVVNTVQFYGRVSKTTIYSAANDIVSFVDDEGAKVVTTDSTGKGEVTIVCKPNTDITFTSSVAKDPDNLSENYSKVITVKSSAEPIYVMPNNVCYWFGYKSSEYQICSEENGWGKDSSTILSTPTENTNYISCNAPTSSSSNKQGIGYKNAIAPSKLHIIWQGITAVSGFYGYFASHAVKNVDTNRNMFENLSSSNIIHTEKDLSSYGTQYVYVAAVSGRANNIYAVWYDDGSDDGNYDKADADLIAPVQKSLTAKKAYAVGEQFVYNQTLYRVAQSIAQGAQITIGTNAVLAGCVTEQINNSYSTTEKKTSDLWIDGKPIYQNTYPISGTLNITAGQYNSITISNISSIKYVISADLHYRIKSADNLVHVILLGSRINNNVLNVQPPFNINTSSTESDIYITLKYTKV